MEKTIFLTGITGFLGTHLVKQLLSNPEVKIIGLIRAADSDSALQRLKKEWWDWPELRAALGSRVLTLAGDITQPRLALNEQDYAFLVENVSHIIHAAADVRLFLALEDLRSVNVTGTLNVLAFAGDVQKQHGLAAFAHVSTAYVAGQRNGEIMEERLSSKSGFTSPYEQSKFEAEELVWQAADQLPVCIFRPGMIVGDSQTGVIKTFNTLYYPLRLYMTGKLRFAPASAGFPVNLVPVDYVASAIFTLMMNPEAIGKVFHLTPAFNDQPTLSEMTIFVRQWAEANLNIHLHRAVFFDLPGFSKLLSWLARISKSKDLAVMATLMPYFQKEPLFNRTNTDQLLGVYPHRWRELLPVLLKEAVYRSFWHRTTRTVHEQVLFRMQSKNKPVTYYDLSLGQVNRRSAAEMLAEIKNIQSAFRAFNINPGERIAIVGLNSSRYFSIFMACGLSGLISTPFYSTCPPSEINKLLADSQPSLLFIGVPDLLKRLNEIIYDGPIVSFCRQEPDSFPVKNAMNWHTFINRQAEHYSNPVLYQVNLDDPVSLHYTSGTTGLQKGVLYHHHHYRWLAETLASMFPWFERNRGGSYLSYLPMNHVVEGILATYSPYYVPAKLDLYFLEEFKDLQWALQKVKPTIFFSVPRFFEKVRASFLENKLARYYMSLSEGFVRRLCRRLLQHGLLQKTGLDRCRQIIVGSATSDAALLGFYKDLGIEVHNAYGLTEAPLVTLNRLGRNQIDSLGEALPETFIRITEDGEICVRGPQVAAGYLRGNRIEPFNGDWLKTGDLGYFDENRYLKLNGRKKDILVTSYAKNVIPTIMEAALRAIPGVSEALLIGEGRSYCSALIWLENENWNEVINGTIREGIKNINEMHSHPEQIKRWVILPGTLTAEDGSLTGSMKLRRSILTERYASIIDAIYQDRCPEGVLFCGGLSRSL